MLKEFNYPGAPEGNLIRRYFSDEFFDLFVWLDAAKSIVSFQLFYNKGLNEHSLNWKPPSSYYHQRVDDGENRPGRPKSTPVLVPDGAYDFQTISRQFRSESELLDKEVSTFVYGKLIEFGKMSKT